MSKESTSINLSNFVWSVAEDLWGDFRHTEFARIILPFLLLRRIECILAVTKNEVIEEYNREKDSGIDLELVLPMISEHSFWNASQYTLASVGATETLSNLEHYISHFSANIRTIFEEFGFSNTLAELDRAKLLYRITKAFAGVDLGKEAVSDRDMSNAYENIILKFAASINEKAGEFMTPKDQVHLATKLVLAPDEEIFAETGVIRTIYDPTCGVGGFLSDALALIKDMSPENNPAKIIPYGQELDPRTHAMALTSMLIQGYEEKHIMQGSTLSDDKLKNEKFHYGLANPPFGIKWAKDQDAVIKEHENLGYAGRFGPGLPRVSDGSMLFLMHLVSKMESPENGGGRIGIVLSGSPLFTGDAGSGESEIRRWLMEEDYVEAIVALPTDMFYNTGIGTYIWILSNKKEERRKGKVQLVNLVDTWTPMRKSEGKKRRYISDEQIDDILRDYESFTPKANIKIFDSTEFAFRKVHIKRPLRAKLRFTDEKIADVVSLQAVQKLSEQDQKALLTSLRTNYENGVLYDYFSLDKAFKVKGNTFPALSTTAVKAITNHFAERDDDFDVVKDAKGVDIIDPSLNDTESIPLKESIDEYFHREVLPHVPDAFIDHSVCDAKDGEVGIVGYEINFNRYFYEYKGHRALSDIDAELRASENRIKAMLEKVAE